MDGEALLGSSINDLINTKDDPEDINIAEDASQISVGKIADISTDTTLELEDVGERRVEMMCVVCGQDGEERGPQLLSCLHTVCQSCVSSQCPECGQETDPSHLVALDTQSSPTTVSESLVSLARLEVGQILPQEMTRLESLLTELQEDTDNTRSLIQETYHSYKVILEQCMNYSMVELDKRQHRKELAIMEKMEEIDNTKRHLEMSLLWNEKNIDDGHRNNVGKVISDRMESLMKYRQNEGPKDLALSLDWTSDKEIFTRTLSDNFGHFVDEVRFGAISRPLEVSSSPKLLVSEPPPTAPECLVSSLLSPEPGLLSLGPLSPLSPVSPSPSAGAVLGHGPVGSGLSSPAHFRSGRLGLSQPDLAQQSQNSNMEYNLSHLASINIERSTSGPITSRPGFTLAELISNVSEDVGSWENVQDNSSHPQGPSTALNNLAALAKLDTDLTGDRGTSWPPPDPTLLLPDLGRNITRSASPGTHSLSPVLGLSVPARGTSPMSPIDSLMPGLGSLSLSPLSPSAMMRSPGSNISQQRSLNSMQIRCKFGQLGPGKGQFNSPHGFCLGLEEEIIVADTNNHRIQVFEKNGTYRYQFGVAGKEEGQLWYPRKVAVMKSSGKFVVCDRGNERSRMQIFSKHGHFVRKIAIRYIDIVAGLAITREGNIVAVDSVTPTIFVILEHGELLRWFDCADYMREPSDIAVAGTDFYVCDFKGHNVVVFTEEGQFLRRIGCENITNFPNGIDISDAGDILIGDSHGNKFHVVVFSNDGTLLGEFECPHVKVSRCCGLKITSEGYVVTLAKNNHHVLVLNTLYIA